MVFLTNRQALVSLPPRDDLRLRVLLAGGVVVDLPSLSSPQFSLPSGTWAAWPVNMPLPDCPDVQV
jgi:hypothetical protein